MAISLGTKGINGMTLVRDVKRFKENFDQIDFSKAPKREPARVRAGRKTFRYGK